jgi:peptide/nickel transport system ATP-binding protein
LPPGCSFAPRCRYVTADCLIAVPELEEMIKGHFTSCARASGGKL